MTEPGRLQSVESQRVGQHWTFHFLSFFFQALRALCNVRVLILRTTLWEVVVVVPFYQQQNEKNQDTETLSVLPQVKRWVVIFRSPELKLLMILLNCLRLYFSPNSVLWNFCSLIVFMSQKACSQHQFTNVIAWT